MQPWLPIPDKKMSNWLSWRVPIFGAGAAAMGRRHGLGYESDLGFGFLGVYNSTLWGGNRIGSGTDGVMNVQYATVPTDPPAPAADPAVSYDSVSSWWRAYNLSVMNAARSVAATGLASHFPQVLGRDSYGAANREPLTECIVAAAAVSYCRGGEPMRPSVGPPCDSPWASVRGEAVLACSRMNPSDPTPQWDDESRSFIACRGTLDDPSRPGQPASCTPRTLADGTARGPKRSPYLLLLPACRWLSSHHSAGCD